MKHLQNIENILLKEEIKRKKKAEFLQCPEFTQNDCKGEAQKLYKIMAELKQALNANDANRIIELCILSNKRLKLIYQFYKP